MTQTDHTSRGGEVDPWQVHEHDSHGDVRHIHAGESSYSFTVEQRIEIIPHLTSGVDVIDLMYFRGLVMGWALVVQDGKDSVDLDELEVYAQNFSIVTAYTDASLYQGLAQALDQMLPVLGIDPPCGLTRVESSNIAGAGYVSPEDIDVPDDEEEGWAGALYVHFGGTSLYRYDGVEPHMAEAFWAAESQGSFLHSNIKSGKYPFEQIKVVA